MKKETWKMVINMLISVLTAIATTLGLTSCLSHNAKSAALRMWKAADFFLNR